MGMWDNIKSKMGMGAPPPPPTLPQHLIQSATAAIEGATPSLTWKQRAIGFGICLGIGLLFSFLVGWPGSAARGRARARAVARKGPHADGPVCVWVHGKRPRAWCRQQAWRLY